MIKKEIINSPIQDYLKSVQQMQWETMQRVNKKIELLFEEKVKKHIPDFTINNIAKYKNKFKIKTNPMSCYSEFIYMPTKKKEILLFTASRTIISRNNETVITWEIQEESNNIIK